MISREQQLIRDIFAPLTAQEPGAFGLRDDAAVLAAGAEDDLVLTADMLVAGVHFLPDDPPDLIARKALRVNLSDLAAKGADPRSYLVSLALTGETGGEWVQGFADGLARDQGIYSCHLLGGDTVRTPGPLTVSVTAIGHIPQGRMVRRAGAAPGDLIYVSGTIGDSALGLAVHSAEALPGGLNDGELDELRQRYLLPQPRVVLAPAVREHASAAMDISDGLAGDVALLCDVSGVSAELTVGRVRLSPAAAKVCDADRQWLETALTGGDDYELLICVAPSKRDAFERAAEDTGVAVGRIGYIVEGKEPPVFRDQGGRSYRFENLSYSHLK